MLAIRRAQLHVPTEPHATIRVGDEDLPRSDRIARITERGEHRLARERYGTSSVGRADFAVQVKRCAGGGYGLLSIEHRRGAQRRRRIVQTYDEAAPHIDDAAVRSDIDIQRGVGDAQAVQRLREVNVRHAAEGVAILVGHHRRIDVRLTQTERGRIRAQVRLSDLQRVASRRAGQQVPVQFAQMQLWRNKER